KGQRIRCGHEPGHPVLPSGGIHPPPLEDEAGSRGLPPGLPGPPPHGSAGCPGAGGPRTPGSLRPVPAGRRKRGRREQGRKGGFPLIQAGGPGPTASAGGPAPSAPGPPAAPAGPALLSGPFPIVGQGDALEALALLAVDPKLGGALLVGPSGSGRHTVASAFRAFMGDHAPFVPVHGGEDDWNVWRGALDWEATLREGRPVRRPGVWEQARGGTLFISRGKSLGAPAAAWLARSLER